MTESNDFDKTYTNTHVARTPPQIYTHSMNEHLVCVRRTEEDLFSEEKQSFVMPVNETGIWRKNEFNSCHENALVGCQPSRLAPNLFRQNALSTEKL